jgi:steroid delta-isomerase-like uncharacterized protein
MRCLSPPLAKILEKSTFFFQQPVLLFCPGRTSSFLWRDLMSTDNIALGRSWFEQVWNQRNVDAADHLASSDCLGHGSTPGAAAATIPEFKVFAQGVLAAFPDIHISIDDTIAQGDRVVLRWHADGTHAAPYMGLAASNAKIAVRGTTILRIANGKIAEAWDNWDQYGFLTQIGALPVAKAA